MRAVYEAGAEPRGGAGELLGRQRAHRGLKGIRRLNDGAHELPDGPLARVDHLLQQVLERSNWLLAERRPGLQWRAGKRKPRHMVEGRSAPLFFPHSFSSERGVGGAYRRVAHQSRRLSNDWNGVGALLCRGGPGSSLSVLPRICQSAAHRVSVRR